MAPKRRFKAVVLALLILAVALEAIALTVAAGGPEDAIIIDHRDTDVYSIPEAWINQAKANLRIAYGHTSHGSQIVTGMELLRDESGLYAFSSSGAGGALSLDEGLFGEHDLGNPDRTWWYNRTREVLDRPGNDRNVVIWSWCGQVSDSTEGQIANQYLALMDQLERDYPQVTFVYMTGHLDGTGVEGNLNLRNTQIRDFARSRGRVLYDFADIESYDPDGNGYLELYADDQCDYQVGNWADAWCARNPSECPTCDCAHSRCLNCRQKGRAFWGLLARIAGWDGKATIPLESTASPTATGTRPLPESTPTASPTSTASIPAPTLTPTATPGPAGEPTGTPTPSATAWWGPFTTVFQQGVAPSSSYAGAEDVIIGRDYSPNANLGALENLETYWEDQEARRTLLRWDISEIPGNAYVESAAVELYRYDGYRDEDQTVGLYMMTGPWAEGTGSEHWVEPGYLPDGATWTSASPGIPWSHPGGDYDASGDYDHGPNGLLDSVLLGEGFDDAWLRLDARAAVTRWVSGSEPNDGLLLRPLDGQYTFHYFHSSEAETPSLRPRLVVVWSHGRDTNQAIHLPMILRGWAG